jgi:Rad3-related DNA helicase
MNKALQAMGRGIRSGTDRCVTVLLDHRYKQQPYRSFLPAATASSREPAEAAARFLQAHGL